MHLILAFLLAVLVPASAQGTERVELSADEAAGWQAVGRINRGRLDTPELCSGTLIAPRWVLTAAHCVSDNPKPMTILFVAGRYGDTYAAAIRAQRIILDPARKPGAPLTPDQLPFDAALIELSRPARGVPPLPLADAPGRLSAATPFAIVAYSNRHRLRPTAQRSCLSVQSRPPLIMTDCPVVSGNSGAPLLRRSDDGWEVVAVLAARGGPGGRASIAVVPGADLRATMQAQ